MASSKRRNDADAIRSSIGFEGPVSDRRKAATTAPGDESLRLRELKGEAGDLADRNYGTALRQCLSRWEVREIADEGRKRVWPSLNRRPVKLVTLDEFVQRWSGFGVDFKFASLPWKKGLSLLGFYVKKMTREDNRPLIFINTAHHPALVGAALDHEMGHHLIAQIFGASSEQRSLLSPTAFKEHLADPPELAADLLVSLGIFPAPIAKSLLALDKDAEGKCQPGLSDAVFAKVLEHVADRYGLRIEAIQGAERKSQALAALVHYTKLRRALLDEYNT